jgi:hypothetical protein
MPQAKAKTAPTPRIKPARQARGRPPFRGRPVYTDEDRKKMRPTMPAEADWVKELLAKG